MISPLMSTTVHLAAEREKERGNSLYGLFHSLHEAYGVMLEECTEAHSEMEDCKRTLAEFFTEDVMSDYCHLQRMTDLMNNAERLACEAIQLAAMAKKTLEFMEEKRSEYNDPVSAE